MEGSLCGYQCGAIEISAGSRAPGHSSTGDVTTPPTYGRTRYQLTVWARKATGASVTNIVCAWRYSWSRRAGWVSVLATRTKLSYCWFCQSGMSYPLVVVNMSYQSAGSG